MGNIKDLSLHSKLFYMNEQVKTLLDKTNLNWSVRQENIQTTSGIIVPNKKALVREDTNDIVGLHSDGYVPYQNHELMDLLHQVSGRTGLEIHRGGEFKGGGRIYVQLKGNDLKLGNDRIEGYLTGVNSFDGSTSLAFGHSNTTISCMNTFFRVMSGLQNKVRQLKSTSSSVFLLLSSLLSSAMAYNNLVKWIEGSRMHLNASFSRPPKSSDMACLSFAYAYLKDEMFHNWLNI